MKKINILLACILLLCSCEDFLTRPPKDKLSPDTFFKTRLECELYTNDFYTIFPSTGIYTETADYIIPDVLSATVMGGTNRTVPSSDDSWTWDKLRDINFFLERSHQCEDEAARIEFEAVARFFRAYFYFEKVKRYGDVPWLDKTLSSDSPELYKGRDSRQMVMGNILADINFAADNLPSKRNSYKVTKWTALALKSRIFLFEGTFRKYHGIEDWESCLTESADAADKFISSSGYKLYQGTSKSSAYRELFTLVDSDQTEIVLSRRFSKSLGLLHNANGRFTSETQGRPGIAKDVINMYLNNNGTPFTDNAGYQTMEFLQECRGRDPRLAQTIRTEGYKRDGGDSEAPNLAATMTGYQLIKFVGHTDYDGYNTSEIDLPIIRAAEVYLNYAEAKAELGTLTQDDIEKTVNKLRDRVGMSGDLSMRDANAKPDGYMKAAYPKVELFNPENLGVILEIRRERTVELMAEGHRYFDIMRWAEGKRFERPFYGMYFPGEGEYDLDGDNKTDFVIYTGTAPAAKDGVVYMTLENANLSGVEGDAGGYITCHENIVRIWNEERDYLYPIPSTDRILTEGAITQNPGWEDGLKF